MMTANPSEGMALQVTGLAKTFAGGRGLCDVSLTAPAGQITGFIGVNGAGKSTTLRCVMGLLRPDAGQVRLFGRPADARGRQRIGFLPEERGLAPRDRIRDAIAFHGRLKGLERRRAFRTADELLDRIGLGGRERARIEDLSKGNAQRVQILCALVHAPDLLVLDEPLSGLDPIAQGEIISLFAEFRARGGALLFSSHSLSAVETLCDRVVVLSRGRTVFEGAVADASAAAQHGAVVVTTDEAGLVAAARRVGGTVTPEAGGGRMGEAGRWRVALPREVTHPALLGALAQQGVPIFAFEPVKPDLEGAFWALSGKTEADRPVLAESRAA